MRHICTCTRWCSVISTSVSAQTKPIPSAHAKKVCAGILHRPMSAAVMSRTRRLAAVVCERRSLLTGGLGLGWL